MSQEKQQRYVPYRSEADEYRIHFLGGPLDGSEIRTDIQPCNDLFVHNVSGRSYRYRYSQTGPLSFYAHLDGFEPPQRVPESPARWLPAWLMWAAVIALAFWLLLRILLAG